MNLIYIYYEWLIIIVMLPVGGLSLPQFTNNFTIDMCVQNNIITSVTKFWKMLAMQGP